ncbi:MAG: S41 family peptidase [bacterium]|nr:S41 family peptidase [bacterium]
MKRIVAAFCFGLLFIAPALAVGTNTEEGVVFSEDEDAVLMKAITLERTICSSVYPAPKSFSACIDSMTTAIEKEFPGSLERARTLGFTELPDGFPNSPETKKMWLLNARILGACYGGNFAKCVEKAYHVLPSAFDPHSRYLSAEEFAEMQQAGTGSFSGIGVEVGGKKQKDDPMVVINPIEGSPAEKAGLLPGDIIVGISKDGTERGMRRIESYETLNDARKDIRGAKGTPVRLLVERQGEQHRRVFVITRGTIDTQIVKHALLTEGNKRYGVIHILQFEGQSCKKTDEAYKKLLREAGGKLDGLIVSVEHDPGGYLHEAHCILDLFTDAESFVLERDRQSISPYLPCRKNFFGQETCQGDIKSYPGDITNGLPILVMINGGSASTSEIFAAGMKHMGRATIAGTPTFQKGSAQSIMPLGDGSALVVTGYEFLIGTMSDWTNVQCLGVTPDIVFNRGFDPKDKDGKRITDCGLDRSIRSGGPMPNAPLHKPIQEANPAHYAASEVMLEAYKKHVVKEDAKRKKQDEILKKLDESEKKKEK